MQYEQELAPFLSTIVDSLEADRENIASDWVSLSNVKFVFKSHRISVIKFRDAYGIPIIEYFIAVIREEKEVGDCPIMSKLVHYLLDKNITPKDVFDICMGLRRTLISYMYKKDLISSNPLDFMNEVANLFDENLSGVLDIFTKVYQKDREIIENSKSQYKKYRQILKIINFVNTKICIIQDNSIILGNKSFFETVGVSNIKEFHKKYEDDLSFMENIDFIEDNKLTDVDEYFKVLINGREPFKTDIYHHKEAKQFTYSGRITTIPDTEPIQYILTLNNITAQIEEFSYDALTGFCNHSKFEEILKSEQANAYEKAIRLALVVVDIPDLKKINAQESFQAGDKLIAITADTIDTLSNDNMFISRLEGSRFGVLVKGSSQQEVYDWCNNLNSTLTSKVDRVTISLTSFDLTENINRLLMRAYDLTDEGNTSEDNIVFTDCEEITLYENLPDQEFFTKNLKLLKVMATSIYFKELPLSSTNQIMKVEKDHVIVRLPKKECCIIGDGRQIYFNLINVGLVKAYIKIVDSEKRLGLLSKFRFDKHSPLNRKVFRVEANDKINIELIHDDGVSETKVLDLNEKFIALSIKRKKSLDEGSVVSLDMKLEINSKFIELMSDAMVFKIEKIVGAYKIVFRMNIEARNRHILKEYISQRQIETIQEMKENISE